MITGHPQFGSIASPLELMTQHTPRERHLPQLPSLLGAPEMYQTHQELIKRQGNSNKPERHYVELIPGTPIWVQHRQNATWEPAMLISQCTPNSYWIIQENSVEQPKVYRCTRNMLKIRSLPVDGKHNAHTRQYAVVNNNAEFQIPPRFDGNRKVMAEDSTNDYIQTSEQLPLPTLDLPNSGNFSETREESQPVEPLCTNDSTLGQSVNNAPDAPDALMHQRKSTRENFGKPANKYNDFYM